MPDDPISLLPAAAALTGAELAVLVQAGVTVQSTLNAEAVFALAAIAGTFNLTKTFVGAVDPTVNEDSSAGYAAGSRGVNTATGLEFYCISAAVGAAVWITLPLASVSGVIAGNWYPPFLVSTVAGSALPVNVARFMPIQPRQLMTLNALGLRVGTAGTGIDLAVYANDPATMRPTGSQLSSTGNIVATATGPVSGALGANVQVFPDQAYWLGINNNNAALACTGCVGSFLGTAFLVGSATLGSIISTSALTCITTPLAYGTWGNLTAAAWTEVTGQANALIEHRVASVP